MSKTAIFPGSFDPITLGHVDIVNRAIPIFDKIIVAIGLNSQKKTLYTLEQRLTWISECFKNEPKVEVSYFEGLTAHYCRDRQAHFLIRGLRNGSDFDYEKTISQANKQVYSDLDTVFFVARPELSYISSTIVRELIIGGADVSQFIPLSVKF